MTVYDHTPSISDRADAQMCAARAAEETAENTARIVELLELLAEHFTGGTLPGSPRTSEGRRR